MHTIGYAYRLTYAHPDMWTLAGTHIYTYIQARGRDHTYIPKYIHTSIHTIIQPYRHTYIYTIIYTYREADIHTYMHT